MTGTLMLLANDYFSFQIKSVPDNTGAISFVAEHIS